MTTHHVSHIAYVPIPHIAFNRPGGRSLYGVGDSNIIIPSSEKNSKRIVSSVGNFRIFDFMTAFLLYK